MKKKTFFFGIFGVMLVFGLVLAGCPQSTDDGGGKTSDDTPTTATISVSNTSAEYKITRVKVKDADTGNQVIDEAVDLATKGGSKSFTIDPGKYTVTVTNSAGADKTSTQFTLAAGASKSLTYTGLDLY